MLYIIYTRIIFRRRKKKIAGHQAEYSNKKTQIYYVDRLWYIFDFFTFRRPIVCFRSSSIFQPRLIEFLYFPLALESIFNVNLEKRQTQVIFFRIFLVEKEKMKNWKRIRTPNKIFNAAVSLKFEFVFQIWLTKKWILHFGTHIHKKHVHLLSY